MPPLTGKPEQEQNINYKLFTCSDTSVSKSKEVKREFT